MQNNLILVLKNYLFLIPIIQYLLSAFKRPFRRFMVLLLKFFSYLSGAQKYSAARFRRAKFGIRQIILKTVKLQLAYVHHEICKNCASVCRKTIKFANCLPKATVNFAARLRITAANLQRLSH